ncbi:beta strand repeat-containing protein, partial [Mariniflexile gromovii]
MFQLPKSCVTQVDFPIVVGSGNAFNSQIVNSSDVSCFGASDGTITVAAQNFDTNNGFQYSIDNGATWNTQLTSPYTITGLAQGTYDVQIRYANTSNTACINAFTQVIGSPSPLGVTASATPITCINGATIRATGTGGTPAYSYELLDTATLNLISNFPSNGVLTDIPAGNYTVRITDAKGCTATTTLTLTESTAPTATITNADYCYDSINGASFEVTATGGQTPYEFNINGGPFQLSNTFTSLTPGNYTIIVRDAYGCTVTLPTETIAQQLSVNAVLTKELDCTASPNAVITGTIAGGYAPFTYEVSINNGAYASLGSTGTSFTYSTATAATYQFRVTDARNCQSVSNVITISPITNPTVSATTTNVSCNGASDGSAQLVGSGGSGGYTFSNDNVTFTASSLFTGLSNGSHTFYVRDSKNCTSSVTVNITQPTPLTATASATAFSCSATNAKQSAVITIAVPTTGTAPYQYSFNNGTTFSSSNTLTVNDNGSDQTFNYVVRDANGCLTAAQSITLTALDPPTDLAFASAAVTCTATTTTVTLTATNGVGPLQYETIAPSPVIRAKQGSNSFAGLAPGTYVFQVTDANGCYYSESYTIAPVTPIAIAGNLVSNVLCKGGTTGSGTYNVSGNATVGNYTYALTAGTLGTGSLTKSGDVLTLSNVAVGTYTVQVTDSATGCVANASITVSEPADVLTLATTSNINANCFNRAQVTVAGSGGTPNYTYAFVQDGASPAGLYTSSNTATLDPITNTNWDVWVMDNQGCTAKIDVVIATDPVPTIDPVALQCYTGSPISITLSGTAVGTPTYSIGGSYQASPTFSINAPGVYNVSIRDGNGCIASRTFEVQPELLLDANMTQDLTCAVDASITLTANGGTGTYSTYAVSSDGGTTYTNIAGSSYTATTDGNYQFRVTDSQGCQAISNIIIVTPKTTPTQTYTQTNVSCNGASDGGIVVTAANGIAPYQYSRDNGATFQASNVFNGLAAGTYNIVVRDSKSCISVATVVTITQPTALSATASATSFNCSATNAKQSAVITIAVPTTGTSPYQYSFNNGTSFSSSNTLTVNDNGSDQTFTYVVRDANGCLTTAQSITLAALDPPTDLAFTSSAVTCLATTSSVSLTATNGVGTLQYETIAPSPIIRAKQTSNSFANLTPGTYVFQVTDANGCYYTESYTIASVTPIAVTGLKLSDVLCNGNNTGAIRFTVSGYAGTYSSTLTSGAGTLVQSGNTVNLTNLIADTYTIEVTDDNTGCTANYSITITEPTALTFTSTSTNVFCTNDESQITVSASGGTVSYTYAAVVTGAAAPVVYDASNVITVDTNSAANLVWDLYVKDANGCITMNTVTITADALPTVTTPALASNQCTASTGFTFTATGTGLAPLSYSINGGTSYQTSPTFTVNTPGSYTVTIKDGNGCTATSSTPTVVYAPLSTNAVLTKDLTCSVPTDATIDITVSGGNAPYSYEVNYNGSGYTAMASVPYSTSLNGTYQFRITDANSCTIETNVITVNPIVNPEITNVVQTQFISCSGEATAAIQITVDNSKGLAPFVFTVVNTTTGQNFGTQTSGLTAGDYEITVTDSKGCTDTFTLVNPITEPDPIVLDYDVNPITCGAGGISLGEIIINSVTGGTANYIYHVRGTNGYSQQLLNQTGATQVFEVVDFGLYEIIITDANGCTLLEQNIIVASPPDDLDITIDATVNCATGGEAEVSIGSSSSITGVGPFYFAIYTGPGMLYDGSPTWVLGTGSPASATFTNLIPDVTYTFIVYDDDTKCYYYETATLAVPTNSTLSISGLTAYNITCTGETDGSVSFNITSAYGSDTDVTYEILDSQTLVTTGISGSDTVPANGTLTDLNLGSLPFGNYILVIEETSGPNAGCSVASLPFNITESAIELNVTASLTKNENCNELGVITAIGKDGTSPYTYQLLLATDPAPDNTSSGWGSVNTFTATADSYIVYVKDAYGCVRNAPITLTRDADPTIDAVTEQCFTGSPISITLSGTTTVGPVTYAIGTSGVAGAYQSSATFIINAAGTYDVFIKDGNGCIATTTYVVQPALLLDAEVTKELDCTVPPDAVITLTSSGGTGTYTTYEVDYNGGGYVGIGGSPYSAAAAGTYQFRVTDSQGCQAETTIITIDPLTNPAFTFTQTNVSCNGGADGSIVVT